MDDAIIVGINRTQDASLCIMRGQEVVCAIQKERLTREKHHWGKRGDVSRLYAPLLRDLGRPVDVLVECFSSDAEKRHIGEYEREIEENISFAPHARRARLSHHLAHLYSVFPPSPFRRAAIMIVDGQGSPAADCIEDWPGRDTVPGDWREVSSFYEADREGLRCLAKQCWEGDRQRPVGLGMFYFLLTQAIFPGEGHEGKVMGLAPYGDHRALGLPALDVAHGVVRIPDSWLDIMADHQRFRYVDGDKVRLRVSADLAAAGQHAFEEGVLALARWLAVKTGAEDLCFAGGTALNCSANDRLWRESPFRRVFIPPAPSDAGTALGCAIYGLTEILKAPCRYRWNTDFLGPARAPGAIDDALHTACDLVIERPDDLSARIADLLAHSRVVGLYQGRSEFGPRALGHRSILGDPRDVRVRDWINARVKQREWFRPLAPIVLLEEAERFFEIKGPSPFMQFAAGVRPEATTVIPAVTHIDNTARLQTVADSDDPLLRRILADFARRTGVPVLLNTSFNRKEEPIVETVDEALATFRHTPLHALAMPPYLLTKRAEPETIF
ncbi:carbamoyltransferase [Acidiferrobacter sp. SPIII_3]|jgi:carbamoyltransferase|uniref:carbamoyltransferase family protein n=1 Tax=Acidiferrobacter sp. SPIII_3 TaxID=1281578 RepID=UPI000D73FCC9|nr:carbamoyltransferase C-terminal domain-containing protein [Acidiferrobacter sp. SPIII_3]AWP22867.1 carbamoyltransferase [Acidiferrobacter sp. SPIII_3]